MNKSKKFCIKFTSIPKRNSKSWQKKDIVQYVKGNNRQGNTIFGMIFN